MKHPLQAYFRINAENFGQFERTLIIADEGSEAYLHGRLHGAEVQYRHACTALWSSSSRSKAQSSNTLPSENWSQNVFNLVTKRGLAHEESEIKWIDCNIGSRLTMKYPGVVLKGRRSRGEVLSIALANNGQHQDTGEIVHAADETTSNIISKSISIGTGRATFADCPRAETSQIPRTTPSAMRFLLTPPRAPTPTRHHGAGHRQFRSHEASVSQVSSDQIFYMQQRGLSEAQAMSLSVNGFVNDLVRQFPMEYGRAQAVDRARNGRLGRLIRSRWRIFCQRRKMTAATELLSLSGSDTTEQADPILPAPQRTRATSQMVSATAGRVATIRNVAEPDAQRSTMAIFKCRSSRSFAVSNKPAAI